MNLLNKEIEKRIDINLDKSVRSDKTKGVMTFGSKNDYPQKIEKLILGSQTGKAAAGTYAKFIAGDGFENEQIGSIVIGKDNKGKNVTLDKMRRKIADSLSKYNGAYVHCNINALGDVGNTKLFPFKNIRYSKVDDTGYSPKLGEYYNWEKEDRKFDKNKIVWYPHFNTNEEVIASNVEEYADGDISAFRGQVYTIALDDEYLYPLSPFDSVYLDMDTEYQVQIFKNRQVRNGFAKKTVMVVNPSDDPKERQKTKEKALNWSGPDGENILIFEAEIDEETGELSQGSSFDIKTVDSNIDDKLFENWNGPLANSIRKAAKALPAVLIDYEEGQLSGTSGEALIQAQKYYNAVTQSERQALSEAIEEIFRNFDNEILKDNTNWRIKPVNIIQ